MNVLLLSIVRNEVDILEAFVRYHAEIADHIVIADHRSVDGSYELLLELEAEGLPLSVRPLSSPGYEQGETITELLWQTNDTHNPDLTLLLDADEFLSTDEERSVREILASLPTNAPSSVPLRHYVPAIDDDLDDPNPLTRIVHRRPVEAKTKWKVIVPRAIAAERAYGVSNGNHHVRVRGSRAEVPAKPCKRLFIAHYPVRSVEQIATRVVSWSLGRITRLDRPPKLNATKQRIVSQLARNEEPSLAWLTEVGLSYTLDRERDERPELVFDPIKNPPTLRYVRKSRVSVLGVVADAIEDVIASIQDERAKTKAREAVFVNRIKELESRLSAFESADAGAPQTAETASGPAPPPPRPAEVKPKKERGSKKASRKHALRPARRSWLARRFQALRARP